MDGGTDKASKNQQTKAAAICISCSMIWMQLLFWLKPQGLLHTIKFTCQMVLPSKLTAEIILAFNMFQSNLNPQTQAVDKNLEKQNFQAARKIFAGV